MKYEDFIRIGFNKNEAKVYVALLELGKSDAKQLIKNTGLHKSIVYDNLDKLIEKGLISFIIENNRKLYIAEPADSLIEFMDKERESLEDKRKTAEQLTKQIEQLTHKKIFEQEATIFRGIFGVKQVFKELFKEKVDYIGFGGPVDSVEIMGKVYWHNFHARQKELGFKGKLLFNNSLRKWGREMKAAPIELRYTKTEFESLTETMIWGNTTAVFVWSEKPIVTVIKDIHVANSYRAFFQMLWDQGLR
ncbi:MAG: helix-turn-helix domain-containing protein [Nanoarchaeota archaeon]